VPWISLDIVAKRHRIRPIPKCRENVQFGQQTALSRIGAEIRPSIAHGEAQRKLPLPEGGMKYKIVIFTRTLASLLATIIFALTTQAQTFDILYTFAGTIDGEGPRAQLTLDPADNIYGTAPFGGLYGFGTMFKLSTATTGSKQTTLYSFAGAHGRYPFAGLVRDKVGNLYGTTFRGGDTLCNPPEGCGTVFELDRAGKETVLHRFSGGPLDGKDVDAGLVQDAQGNLFGATNYGGAHDQGLVFRIDKGGTESILHSFTGSSYHSVSRLTLDEKGNVYGTTSDGGTSNNGTVFKVTPTGKWTILHSFDGGSDGGFPLVGLLRDPDGNLYGTTYYGGTFGYGTVFKVDAAGFESILYSFSWGTDGGLPYSTLVRDAAGNLYGTTYGGGDTSCGGYFGCGVLFKLDVTGALTVLHSFLGPPDGISPSGGLVQDADGNLYGTTVSGGDASCNCGIVFKLDPQ
jgi:uncharacterized repeat protein (TIGR03803 family)